MNIAEYEKMYNLEDHYWWFQGRKYIILDLMNNFINKKDSLNILDIGCGTGMLLSELSRFGEPIGLDFSPLALAFCRKRGIKDLMRASVDDLPIKNNSIDIITAFDLIEHIEDDKKLCNSIFDICKNDGYFILTVPAYQFLWSKHDESLYHYRRYTKKQIEDMLTKAGFKINKLTYAITLTFIPIAIYRFIEKIFNKNSKPKSHLITLPEWINSLLIMTLKLESKILSKFNLPFGVSIICIAQKNVKI